MLYHAFVATTGARIVGEKDCIPGIANVRAFDALGQPLYAGETDVFWDEQEAVLRTGVTWWLDEDGDEYPATALVLRAVDREGSVIEEVAPKPFPTSPSRLRAERALALLREARDILREIGATQALERVRAAIASADGAVRAASARDAQATRVERVAEGSAA